MPIYKKIIEPKNFVASNLRLLLHVNDVQSKELGLAIGETVATISNWSRGLSIPSVQKIQRVCLFFDISLDDFVAKDLQKTIKKYKTA